MTEPDAYLAVEAAMSPAERETFLATFLRINPRWEGAAVADVLAEQDSRDDLLRLTEPAYEEHGADVPERSLLGTCVRAIALAYPGLTVPRAEWSLVRDLVERARRVEGCPESLSWPTRPLPGAICRCGHWYEEHDWRPGGGCGGCDAADVVDYAHAFDLDPEATTPEAIADRGGDPDQWPAWVRRWAHLVEEYGIVDRAGDGIYETDAVIYGEAQARLDARRYGVGYRVVGRLAGLDGSRIAWSGSRPALHALLLAYEGES